MKKVIQTQFDLKAPVERVWDLVKTGEQWENWLPILTGSRVEGHTRYCDLEGGDVLEERFLASNAEKTFIYVIDKQKTFPATDITGIMRFVAEGENTRLFWSVEMEVENEETFEALKESISGVYRASAEKLEALASGYISA